MYNKFTVTKIIKSDGPNTIYRFRCNRCNFVIDTTAYNMRKLILMGDGTCKSHMGYHRNRYKYKPGDMIGNYLILEETSPNKYNQMKYTVSCTKCGYIYYDVLLADIRRKVKSEEGCNHSSQNHHIILGK